MKPLNTVNNAIHHSPNKTTEIKGNLGHFFERSKDHNDIKVQLFSKLKNTKILYNTIGNYELLSRDYDYVVIANGDINFTNELGCWMEWLNTSVRGAVVLGEKASLNLVVTDITLEEIDKYWELFLYTEKIKYIFLEEFKLKHLSGLVYPHKVGNLFLAGNAGGMIDPFLGFGIVSSIISGVMTALSIVNNEDYEKLLRRVVKKNLWLYEFRKEINSLENSAFDILIQLIGLPIIKHITYYTPLNVIKYGAHFIKLKSKIIG